MRIHLTGVFVDERLVARDVRFVQPPTDYGTVICAVFDDTCGNLVPISQEKEQQPQQGGT